MPRRLTEEQVSRFERDGYLVVPDFVSPDACDALKARALELVEEFDPREYAAVFSAYISDNHDRAASEYIRDSADKISFFFEENAFDETGALRVSKERSLCKIGHAPHDCDPVFDRFSRTEAIAAVASDIGIARPLLAQSMYLFKQPGIGAEIGCHQDASFIYTEPSSVVGFWFALEDADVGNGCMWALPGGHRLGLKSRFVRTSNGETFVGVNDVNFAEESFVPLPAKQGTLILLHGMLPHLSKANTSPRSRHAYTIHLIDGACEYLPDNWLLRPASNPFRAFV